MAYTDIDFPTKKSVKEAIAKGERVTVYQPGPFGEDSITSGVVYLEGPHYPKPHKWYAQGVVENGYLKSIK